MAEKILIVDSDLKSGLEDTKFLQILVANIKDETLYSEFQSINEETGSKTYDTHELAVNIEDMIKIRDYLTKVINKTAQKNYPYPKSLTDYYGNTYEVVEGE